VAVTVLAYLLWASAAVTGYVVWRRRASR